MNAARLVVAGMLVTLGSQVAVPSAPLGATPLSPAAQQTGPASPFTDPASPFSPVQPIRIQPVDSTHVCLRFEGWMVDSAGFSFPRSPSPDFVPVVATPGRNMVTTPSSSMPHDNFELSIGRSGSLGFGMSSGRGSRETYPASAQTIQIEPIDATRLRLHLVGPENLIVDSVEFSLVPGLDSIRVIAAPGSNNVAGAGSSRVVNTFELSVTPKGLVRF